MNNIEILEQLTSIKSWRAIDGPASRCGMDFWYQSRETNEAGAYVEAYLNNDQGYLTVTVDGDTIFSGMREDLEDKS